MVKPLQIYECINATLPFETQEGWDNSGLLVDSGIESNTVIVCLDVTQQVVDKAVETGTKIIVSHHPVIFGGMKKVSCDDVLYSLIKNDISVISAHTNFDVYRYGTCYSIAEKLGLQAVFSENREIGLTAAVEKMSAEQLAHRCKAVFGNAACTLPEKQVERVFICAGSGSGMMTEVISSGADCYITGECKYHDMLDLAHKGIAVITMGHDSSEKISLETLADIIKEKFTDIDVEIYVAESLQHYI